MDPAPFIPGSVVFGGAPIGGLTGRCDLDCVPVAGRYTLLDRSAAEVLFTLRHSAMTAAVIGARTAEEIAVDVSYLETRIPGALWAELERAAANAVSPICPPGPTDRILPDQVRRTE